MGAMATEPTLGTRIRRARERLRWTQQRLADALSVSVRTVNDWENDRTQPRSSIGALEDVLGVSLDSEEGRQARAISGELRKLIAEHPADEEAKRFVIGVLEGTITRPPPPSNPGHARPGEDDAPPGRMNGS